VLPPPNKAGVLLVLDPKPVVLFWPKMLALLLAEPNADVVVLLLLLVDPKPPKVELDVPPLPNNPPPVVELPNGFEPKAVEVLLVPKPPV